MKNKKIWARIGAILACVLLVGALAVPCFADETAVEVIVPAPPPDGYTPPYGSAIDSFTSTLDPRANNDAYSSLLDYYYGFGDSRFFDVKTFVSGTMDFLNDGNYSIVIPNTYNIYPDTSVTVQYFGKMNLDCYSLSIHKTDSLLPGQHMRYSGGYFEYVLYFDEDSCMLGLSYYLSDYRIPEISFRYEGTYGDTLNLTLNSFSIDGDKYPLSDIYQLDVAFAVSAYDDSMLLPEVAATYYSVATYLFSQKVYSPYEFYQGFKASYNLGYADAERYAYQYGYEEGHTDGYTEGFEAGVSQGETNNKNYEDGYSDGRTDALGEVSSGDFGRNFLGGIFTAPIDALREFTIVEWTTENGVEVTITLMTFFSAVIGVMIFVWFLKMFAGG